MPSRGETSHRTIRSLILVAPILSDVALERPRSIGLLRTLQRRGNYRSTPPAIKQRNRIAAAVMITFFFRQFNVSVIIDRCRRARTSSAIPNRSLPCRRSITVTGRAAQYAIGAGAGVATRTQRSRASRTRTTSYGGERLFSLDVDVRLATRRTLRAFVTESRLPPPLAVP